MMNQWFVFDRYGKLIESVFYVDSMGVDEIRKELIEHDGYSHDIDVCRAISTEWMFNKS
jgi:hypothetical protein